MRQLVGKCKHLRRLSASAVDKHKRGILLGQNKSSKLVRLKLAMGVIPDNAVDDNKNSRFFHGFAQSSQCICPSRVPGCPSLTKTQHTTNPVRDNIRRFLRSRRSHEQEFLLALIDQQST